MTPYYPGPNDRSWESFRESLTDLMKAVAGEPLPTEIENTLGHVTDSLRWAVEQEIERALRERDES